MQTKKNNSCENKHSRSRLKCVLTNNEQQTVILHNNVIREVRGVHFIESLNNKIVVLVPQKCP